MHQPGLHKAHTALPAPFLLFGLLILAATCGLLATPYYAYAPAPGLLLLFLLAIWHQPSIGLYSIIFIIPFAAYRQLGGAFQFLRVHWVIAFFLVLILFLKSFTDRRKPAWMGSNLWPHLLLFLGISLVSALLAGPDHLRTSWKNVLLLIAAYTFIALCMSLLKSGALHTYLPSILVVSMVISASLGVLDNFFGWAVFTSEGRLIGGAVGANNFSLMCIFCLPLLFHFLCIRQSWPRKALTLGATAILLSAIVLSFSRGGGLVLALTMVLILWQHRKKLQPKHVGLVAVVVTGALITLAVLTPEEYWSRFQRIGQTQVDKSIGRRVTYLYVAKDAVFQNPVLGHGPGTFIELYAVSDYARRFATEARKLRRYAHNTYLEVVVGTGLLGLAVFLALLLRALRNMSDARRLLLQKGKEETASLVQAYQTSFASVLFYLLIFSGIYHKYLLLSLAISHCCLKMAEEEE